MKKANCRLPGFEIEIRINTYNFLIKSKNMKRVIYTVAALMLTVSGFAQKDTTKPNEPDTIKVGNFVIVKKE